MYEQFLMAFGSGLCHQLPERSFFGGGLQVPVCARDTGIYIGFVVSAALVCWLHRGERPTAFPTRGGWAVIVLLISSMALDAITEYAGLRETTNALRLTTGVAAGFAVAALVLPLIGSELFVAVPPPQQVLSPGRRLAWWSVAMPMTVGAVWWGAPLLGRAYPTLVALATLVTFTVVNMVFTAVVPRFDRAARTWRDLAGPAALGLALACAEIAAAAWLRVLLGHLGTALGG